MSTAAIFLIEGVTENDRRLADLNVARQFVQYVVSVGVLAVRDGVGVRAGYVLGLAVGQQIGPNAFTGGALAEQSRQALLGEG